MMSFSRNFRNFWGGECSREGGNPDAANDSCVALDPRLRGVHRCEPTAQLCRIASINSSLLISDRPSMPIFVASSYSSSLVRFSRCVLSWLERMPRLGIGDSRRLFLGIAFLAQVFVKLVVLDLRSVVLGHDGYLLMPVSTHRARQRSPFRDESKTRRDKPRSALPIWRAHTRTRWARDADHQSFR